MGLIYLSNHIICGLGLTTCHFSGAWDFDVGVQCLVYRNQLLISFTHTNGNADVTGWSIEHGCPSNDCLTHQIFIGCLWIRLKQRELRASGVRGFSVCQYSNPVLLKILVCGTLFQTAKFHGTPPMFLRRQIQKKKKISGDGRFCCWYINIKIISPITGLEWPRGFQEVKVPRLRDNGTGWW